MQATTLEHTYRSQSTSITSNQRKYVIQTVESALTSSFQAISDLIVAAQSDATLKCAEIEKL